MCNFNVDSSKIFSGTALLPRFHPFRRSGASRLRASLGTFGPSIVVSPVIKMLVRRLGGDAQDGRQSRGRDSDLRYLGVPHRFANRLGEN